MELGAAEINGEGELDAPRTERVGNALECDEVMPREHVGAR